ncbi:MAG TPA: sterol desaturase family protein [Vicinamibacterales bacterium]|jgi:sterol desaturase/sphingolipid hydroxylase (fatty acid hydroxylase superfamily)
MPERSEWSTVFERFPTGRVPIVGSIGIFLHDWSKPADGHPQLFDRPSLELLTTAHPRAVAGVYSTAALILVAMSVWSGISVAAIAGRAAAGMAAWSLTEYLIHRYAFHFVPQSRLGVALAYLSHGVHHAYPRDPDRLVLPLVVSLPVGAVLLALTLAAGPRAYPLLAGFAVGYLAYDLIHYRIHAYEATSGVFKWLRLYHFQHHFAVPDRQFGVSTPIWDYVFRTGR